MHHISRTLSAVSTVYLILLLPLGIVETLELYWDVVLVLPPPTKESETTEYVHWLEEKMLLKWCRGLCFHIYHWNFAINFFLYYLTGEKFRGIVLRTLKRPATGMGVPPTWLKHVFGSIGRCAFFDALEFSANLPDSSRPKEDDRGNDVPRRASDSRENEDGTEDRPPVGRFPDGEGEYPPPSLPEDVADRAPATRPVELSNASRVNLEGGAIFRKDYPPTGLMLPV